MRLEDVDAHGQVISLGFITTRMTGAEHHRYQN
jgi:hypothetical protein